MPEPDRIEAMFVGLANDVIYAARALRRSPGFTVAAVALLGAGIGGTTVLFSVTDVLMLRNVAAARPAELVRLVNLLPGRPPVSYFSYLPFEEWRTLTRTIYDTYAQADLDGTLEDGGGSRLVRIGVVSPDYFSALGITAMFGRVLTPNDEWASGGELAAVLSYRFWQDYTRGDPGVIGRVVRLNGQPFVVAGVLPRGVNGTA